MRDRQKTHAKAPQIPDAEIELPEDDDRRSIVWNAPTYKAKLRIAEIPRKTLYLSTTLFIGGVCMLTVAAICQFRCKHSLGLWVLGGILIIPGVHSMYILLNFVRGVRGYHYSLLPETDE